MNIKFEQVIKKSVDYTLSKDQMFLDYEIFSLLHYLMTEYEASSEMHLDKKTQGVLLFSSLKHKMAVETIASLSQEYIFHLNNEVLNDYLSNDTINIDCNDIVCLATFLTDKSFLNLKNLILNKNENILVRKKAMHLLSFSESKECFNVLSQVTPKGFIFIPAGEFIFGSNNSLDEKYNKKVWLPSYYISKYPVTQKAYNNDILFVDDKTSIPCHNMTWYAAYEFAKKHKVCLPTEAQWEKAARGCDGREYPWGNEFNKDFVNSFETDINDFTPVDQFENDGLSPYGVVDCVGNCWEWTCSIYDKYETEIFMLAVDDSVQGDRVLRGGAFDFDRYGVTCTNRYRCNPENGWDTHGFRVVINI